MGGEEPKDNVSAEDEGRLSYSPACEYFCLCLGFKTRFIKGLGGKVGWLSDIGLCGTHMRFEQPFTPEEAGKLSQKGWLFFQLAEQRKTGNAPCSTGSLALRLLAWEEP